MEQQTKAAQHKQLTLLLLALAMAGDIHPNPGPRVNNANIFPVRYVRGLLHGHVTEFIVMTAVSGCTGHVLVCVQRTIDFLNTKT